MSLTTLCLLSLIFVIFHVVQCVEESSSLSSSLSSSSSSLARITMLKKRAITSTTVFTNHLHSASSSPSSSSSSSLPAATKLALLVEVAAKETEDGCSSLIEACLEECDHSVDCEISCGARASVMYFHNYEVAHDAVTKACDNKCNGRIDGKMCRQICNKGFRDHYYMQPQEDRALYCVNTVKTRVNEFIANKEILKCAVDCQKGCDKTRKFGTMAHATCAVHCTHNSAHAYFELMRSTVQRIHKDCGSDVTCIHGYTDSWILTSDECEDGILDWPSTPSDASYCPDWCEAFYDTTLPKEMSWAHSCKQGCETAYDKTERKWGQKKCESLCGIPPKTPGDEEAFVSGCYSGCSPSIAKD